MSRSEAAEQEEIRLLAAQLNWPLWRNNSGACRDETGRLIRYGLGNDSAKINAVWKSPDLVGITPILIRPEYVGRIFGVFTGVEVKKEGWRGPSNKREIAQDAFHSTVRAAGGISFFAAGVADYKEKMGIKL